ncbi:hypothetical protein SOVF_196030 [Spinacia oleracea]|nr:hypothetical protein SOVF_196030 [Spinacia oleracea]
MDGSRNMDRFAFDKRTIKMDDLATILVTSDSFSSFMRFSMEQLREDTSN